jgi:hypothetical protein
MSNDDFYTNAARGQLAQLEADKAQALADLATLRAAGDTLTAQDVVQKIANINAQERNLHDLHQQYVLSQQPPSQPQMTQEELEAKPWHKMTVEDALELAKTSRYGRDLSFNDPNVVAGYNEAARRRARGE